MSSFDDRILAMIKMVTILVIVIMMMAIPIPNSNSKSHSLSSPRSLWVGILLGQIHLLSNTAISERAKSGAGRAGGRVRISGFFAVAVGTFFFSIWLFLRLLLLLLL